jgi:hypothetical protein
VNLKSCQDVMISYVDALIKKLTLFRESCYVLCVQA